MYFTYFDITQTIRMAPLGLLQTNGLPYYIGGLFNLTYIAV
jgi:hypothetical protein